MALARSARLLAAPSRAQRLLGRQRRLPRGSGWAVANDCDTDGTTARADSCVPHNGTIGAKCARQRCHGRISRRVLRQERAAAAFGPRRVVARPSFDGSSCFLLAAPVRASASTRPRSRHTQGWKHGLCSCVCVLCSRPDAHSNASQRLQQGLRASDCGASALLQPAIALARLCTFSTGQFVQFDPAARCGQRVVPGTRTQCSCSQKLARRAGRYFEVRRRYLQVLRTCVCVVVV